jgi:hypothetical protein
LSQARKASPQAGHAAKWPFPSGERSMTAPISSSVRHHTSSVSILSAAPRPASIISCCRFATPGAKGQPASGTLWPLRADGTG